MLCWGTVTKLLASAGERTLACGLLLCSLMVTSAVAKVYSLPETNSRLIGEIQYHKVVKGDYFQLIAEKYDVGFLALMAANPNVDPFLPELGQQ